MSLRTHGRAALAAALVTLVLPDILPAQEPKRAQTTAGGLSRREITSDLRLGVARGLAYLIQAQSSSGDFDANVPVAVNALCGLAFLAGGVTEDVGPTEQSEALRKCTAALLRRQDVDGYFDDGQSRMYGHGFATLFLAQLYGTSPRNLEATREALKKALHVIQVSQSRDGGWDYLPHTGKRTVADSFGDTSITVCQTLALRAAKNLGLRVDGTVVNNARRYIERAQNEDGGFRYRPQLRGFRLGESGFARSSAGICTLYSLGEYGSASIERGFVYLDKNYRSLRTPFLYYGHYYCAQAMFQAGGRRWREYFPWARNHLLAAQRKDGSWPARSEENKNQCTAMALIVLQLPYRFLPIHER